jgi:hypothetical protein
MNRREREGKGRERQRKWKLARERMGERMRGERVRERGILKGKQEGEKGRE